MLLALWLGAALLFSTVVAPTVFTVLRSFDLANANEIAGTIVTRSLAIINVAGFLIGLLAVAMLVFLRSRINAVTWIIELASLAVLVVTTALGQWVIAARMRALRASMVTIDLVSPADPRRIAFTDLHHYSVLLLGVAMIAAVVAIVVSLRLGFKQRNQVA